VSEPFAAHVALMWLHFKVNKFDVIIKIVLEWKRGVTGVTLEFLYSVMNVVDVIQHDVLAAEGDVTPITLKPLRQVGGEKVTLP
jgi:hypothetical protein